MADPQTQSQWYKLQGDDQKWYSVQAGSPDEARARVAGQVANAPSATKQAYDAKRASGQLPKVFGTKVKTDINSPVAAVGSGIVEGFKGVYTGARDIGKDLWKNPNWINSTEGKESTFDKFILDPMAATNVQGRQQMKQPGVGNKVEGAARTFASGVPFVGPWASGLYDKAKGGDATDRWEAGGELVGGLLGAKSMSHTIDSVTGMVGSGSLKERAAKLDTKVLETAKASAGGKPGLLSYDLATGYEVAKQGIIGTLKSLPDKIAFKRKGMDAQVDQVATGLDVGGKSLNVESSIDNVAADVAHHANLRGQLSPETLNGLKNIVKGVKSEFDPQTQTWVPRNLRTLSFKNAIELQKGLDAKCDWDNKSPSPEAQLARRMHGAIGDEIGKTAPDLQKLRSGVDRLETAETTAREHVASVLNGGRTMARGFIYSNMPAIATYLSLKAMGLSFGPAIGVVITLRTLAESTLSRTARAALYAKAAELSDSVINRNARPTGAAGASGPQSRPPGLSPGTGPQGAGPKALTGQVAPPTPGSPAWAAYAKMAGAAAYRQGQQQGAAQHPMPAPPAPMARPDVNGAGSNTKVTMPNAAPDAMSRGGKPTDEDMALESLAVMGGRAAIAERQVMVQPKAPKNVQDREELYRRLTYVVGEYHSNPTEANRIAAEKAGQEYAKARAEALSYGKKMDATDAKAVKPSGLLTTETYKMPLLGGHEKGPASDIEKNQYKQAMLDFGYHKLAEFSDGPAHVKALKKQAQDMQKAGVKDYSEVIALSKAIETLKEMEAK